MGSVRELRQVVSSHLASFDVALLSGTDAATAVAEWACIEKMAATGRMLAAVRVDETNGWQGEGDKSPADWLARKSGSSVGDAAGMLGTGRKTKKLAKTRQAMQDGKLSPAQAKAVADAADADPDAEDNLLDTADKETFQNLQRKSQQVRSAATDDERRDRRIWAKRSARGRIDDEGAFTLWLRGPAVDGARLLALWKPLQEQRFRDALATGGRDSYDNRAYDALMDLLLAGATPSASTGSTGSTAAGAGDGVAAGPSDPAAAEPPVGSSVPGRGQGKSATGGPPDSSDPVATPRPADVTGAGSSAGTSPSHRLTPGCRNDPAAGPAAHASCRGATEPTQAGCRSGRNISAGANAGRRGPPDPSGTEPPAPPSTGPPGPRGVRPPGHAPPPGDRDGPPPPAVRPPGGANTKVIVRIDHAALVRGHAEASETVEIVGLGQVSVTTVKELMADAFIAAVVMKGHDVVNVAHLGRGVNAYQRTALEAVNVACSNIACNRSVAIQIDHRTPWTQKAETVLTNQDPLCSDDHNKKTHHGWMLVTGRGRRLFVPPEHPRHPDSTRPVAATSNQAAPPDALANAEASPHSSPEPSPIVSQPTLC